MIRVPLSRRHLVVETCGWMNESKMEIVYRVWKYLRMRVRQEREKDVFISELENTLDAYIRGSRHILALSPTLVRN